MKYLAVDYGERKTGLAIGNDELRIASPFGVIAGGDESFLVIKRLVYEEGIDALVVGLPSNDGGQKPHSLERIKLFIDRLIERLRIPVFEVDEHLTTKEAQRIIKEEKTDVEEDALAAMLILQDFFESNDYKK